MNKRRLFASAMAACMLLSTMPSTALAADISPDATIVSNAAEAGTGLAAGTNDPTGGNNNTNIDGTGTQTPTTTVTEVGTLEALQAAITEGKTNIKLGADIEAKETIAVTKNTVIDLGGHTLTYTGTGEELAKQWALKVAEGATLTIQNGKIVSNSSGISVAGKLYLGEQTAETSKTNPLSVSAQYTALEMDNGKDDGTEAYITVWKNATVSNDSAENNSYNTLAMGRKGTVDVYGTITRAATTPTDGKTKIANVISSYSIAGDRPFTGTLNIYDGARVATHKDDPDDVAITMNANYTVNVYGGTIQGDTGIYVGNGTLKVKSGEIIATREKEEFTGEVEGSMSTVHGHAISIASYKDGKPEVTISGGEICAAEGVPAVGNYAEEGKSTFTISGGTFHDASAFAYLAKDASIKLGADIEAKETIAVTKDTVIDLGGHTLTYTGTGEELAKQWALTVAEGATLKIQNGTIDSDASGISVAGELYLGEQTAETSETNPLSVSAQYTALEMDNGKDDGTEAHITVWKNATVSNDSAENNSYNTLAMGRKGTVDVYGTITRAATTPTDGKTKIANVISSYSIAGGRPFTGTLNIYDGARVATHKDDPDDVAITMNADYTVNVHGGTIQGDTGIYVGNGTLKVKSGEIIATREKEKFTGKTEGSMPTVHGHAISIASYKDGKPEVTISGGKMAAATGVDAVHSYVKLPAFISGGYFTTDPTEYLAEGYMAGASDIAEYEYLVVEGTVADEIVTSEALPEVKVPTNMTDADKVNTAVGGVDVSGLAGQANQAAANLAQTEEEKTDLNTAATQALEDASIEVPEDGEITLHVQTYLDMKATEYQKYQAASAEGETAATPFKMTLDITPMFKVIAATTAVADDIVTTDGANKNAVELEGKGGKLDITTPVTVTIPLPTGHGMTGDKAYVSHKAKDGKTYVYTATLAEGKITFTNPHGFSEFTITSENPAAASVGDTFYATLQDAVNAALAATETATIEIVASGETAPSATVNTPGSFKVQGTATITAGGNVNMAKSDVDGGVKYTFTAKPTTPSYSGGGSSSSSTPTYTVSVPTKVQNGSVSVSSKNPTKGSTVTLTVTPDKGYELATLTVTDKDGNKIALTDKGNGKFTFTMPASKVDIKATFVKTVAAPDAPVNPFYDVAETDYFFDAVLWANENGITSGVGSGKFAPNATCTRAQMVTFLWNAAGCPNVEDPYASFTDVSANDYYYKAVLWAKANGITSGTGEGVFSPDQICNRAQMATFLYKFAEGKAVGSSNRFADVTASDYYAQPVQWAVENGITSGTGADTFGPNDPCTRAQMVTFLYRLLAD